VKYHNLSNNLFIIVTKYILVIS